MTSVFLRVKIDGAGRPTTLGRRALLFLRDEHLATVKEIATVGGVSASTVKALLSGTLSRPSLDAACSWRDAFGIPVDFWRRCAESQDPDLTSFQSRHRR